MNALTSLIARLRGTTAAAPTPIVPDEAFAKAWLEMWTANGGSVTFDLQDPDKIWVGWPMYELSPQFKADEERRQMQIASIPEASRDSLGSMVYISNDHFYSGKMRGLYDLLASVPGGTAAVKAVLRERPLLGFRGVSAEDEDEPLGWDDLLADYRAKEAAEQQESLSGRYRQILDEHSAAWPTPCTDQPGTERREAFEASYRNVTGAEEAHERYFIDPASLARGALLRFPAPDRAALLTKIEIIEAHEEEGFEPHIFADVRRLLAPPQVNGGAWEEALADYRAKRAASDAIALDEPGCDEAVDAYCEAMDHLIEKVPAPDAAALRIKLELVQERNGTADGGLDGVMPHHFLAIAAEALRFAGAEG